MQNSLGTHNNWNHFGLSTLRFFMVPLSENVGAGFHFFLPIFCFFERWNFFFFFSLYNEEMIFIIHLEVSVHVISCVYVAGKDLENFPNIVIKASYSKLDVTVVASSLMLIIHTHELTPSQHVLRNLL